MADGSTYGYDISTFNPATGAIEVDPLFPLIPGPDSVLQSVARRYMTPRNFLRKYPDAGYDLRAQLGRRMSNIAVKRMIPEIEAEALKEERVRAARVTEFRELGANTGNWILRIKIVLAEGPFTLVIAASSLSVELLETVKG